MDRTAARERPIFFLTGKAARLIVDKEADQRHSILIPLHSRQRDAGDSAFGPEKPLLGIRATPGVDSTRGIDQRKHVGPRQADDLLHVGSGDGIFRYELSRPAIHRTIEPAGNEVCVPNTRSERDGARRGRIWAGRINEFDHLRLAR